MTGARALCKIKSMPKYLSAILIAFLLNILVLIYFPCVGLMLAGTSVNDYRTHAGKQVNESRQVG